MKEIWLFEHKFQDRNVWTTLNLGVIKFVKKLFIKLINFVRIPISNRTGKVEVTSFGEELVQRSQKNFDKTEIN